MSLKKLTESQLRKLILEQQYKIDETNKQIKELNAELLKSKLELKKFRDELNSKRLKKS